MKKAICWRPHDSAAEQSIFFGGGANALEKNSKAQLDEGNEVILLAFD